MPPESTSDKKTTRPTREAGSGPIQLGNALDTFRVVGTILVVYYHASLTYLANPLRLTLWVAYDSSRSQAFEVFAYWVNAFAMPLFFLAAGISAPAACESRGPRTFLVSRARRLLKPLLFGCVTILPLCYLIWGYGLVASGQCDLTNILRWRFPENVNRHLYGLGHLWFLEYLYLVCILWVAGWWLSGRLGLNRDLMKGWQQRLFASAWKPILLALPTAVIFFIDTDTMLRVNNSLIPNPFRLLHYVYFFMVGGWISTLKEPKQVLTRNARTYLVFSLVVFGVMTPSLVRHAASPLAGWELTVVCLLSALFAWLFLLGGLGCLLLAVEKRGVTLKYLSEASFWIYMIHLPVVALMQVVLLPLHWPSGVKFLIVSSVAVGVSVWSYEYLIRYSALSMIINGTRKRTSNSGRLGLEFAWIATAVIVIVGLSWGVWSMRSPFWGNNFGQAIAGRVYRSGRLTTKELDAAIHDRGLKAVITFTGAGDRQRWFAEQRRLCEINAVLIRPLAFNSERPPSRDALNQLLSLLESTPRPLLVQDSRGIKTVGFASALAGLLEGQEPSQSLRHFDFRHGDFGGPEHSSLAVVVYDYQSWLKTQHLSHTPARFRNWAGTIYSPTNAMIAAENRGTMRR